MSGSNSTVVASSVPFYISSISIRLGASNKKLDFAELKSDSQRHEIRHSSEQDQVLSANFDPAISVITITEHVSLSVHCQHHVFAGIPRKTTVKFSLSRNDILSNTVDRDGRQGEPFYLQLRRIKFYLDVIVYQTTERKLQPNSDDLQQLCPRFRLLVIGKTGVGKSSLIHQAFKIKEHVSSNNRGEANIDTEFVAPDNERFVLHDSQGFESGDNKCFTVAKEFINRRRKMPKLQDQIHAVWLCLPIPHADGRLLESGVEEFLRLRKEILDNIPVIVVFTKYDVFADKLELDVMESNYDEATLEALKLDTLNKLCVQPLKEIAGDNVLHATVSTKEEHESTMRRLIDLTTTNVEKFVNSEAALAVMTAQRVDIGLKIRASIEIVKKRYWRSLATGMNVIGFTMSDCLSLIHKDIIDVWNFNDLQCHLTTDNFKDMILKDLDSTNLPHTTESFASGLSVVSKLAEILMTVDSSIASIAVPIAIGVVLVKWIHDVYQQTNITLRRIMTYIVDLTCIMQILFLLAQTGSISRRVIKIAVKAYAEAGKGSVHSAIQSNVSVASGGDQALKEIVKLILNHAMKSEDIQGLRAKITRLTANLQEDEEW
ncbi:hypothetical protein BDR04DRAFT_1155522 [Suillus decipiens]|nr:hypothetical protein BDR04DRAFT_1155522 [Suillus decipiens]